MLFSLCTSIRLLQPSLAGCAPRSQVPPPWNLPLIPKLELESTSTIARNVHCFPAGNVRAHQLFEHPPVAVAGEAQT